MPKDNRAPYCSKCGGHHWRIEPCEPEEEEPEPRRLDQDEVDRWETPDDL